MLIVAAPSFWPAGYCSAINNYENLPQGGNKGIWYIHKRLEDWKLFLVIQLHSFYTLVKQGDTTMAFLDNNTEKIFTVQGISSNHCSNKKSTLLVRGFVTRKHLTIDCADHSRYFADYKIKTIGK